MAAGWISKPDSDDGNVDDALVNELPLVAPDGDGTGTSKLVERPLHGVWQFVNFTVKCGSPFALAALGHTPGDLVGRLRDRGPDRSPSGESLIFRVE